ncbi:hypothetical protein [Methylomonas sp. YC3]
MADLTIFSNNGKLAIELFFAGEIHFGPMYFRPKFVGFQTEATPSLIAENIVWSIDDGYVALAEVSSNLESMKLHLINAANGSLKTLDECKGLLIPLHVSNKGEVEFEWREKGTKEIRIRA